MSEREYQRLPLHHAACTPIFEKLQDCERDHPIARAFGKCSEFHVAFSKCLRQNKHNSQLENSKKSLLRYEKYRAKLKAEKEQNP